MLSPDGAYGAVEGRVQFGASGDRYDCLIYNSLYGQAVPCHCADEGMGLVEDAAGKLAVVEGWVTRDAATGRPLAIQRVDRVTMLTDTNPWNYREARGAVPVHDPNLAPERMIRRLRDTWAPSRWIPEEA